MVLFIRQVPLYTVAELSLRMQLRSWLEIFSGMMSFDLNGIRCSHTVRYWRNAHRLEQWLFTGLKRSVKERIYPVICWFCTFIISLSSWKYEWLLPTWSFVVQFPFFCSDREYLIGRRIWEAGKTYYCLTKVLFEENTHWCLYCSPLSTIISFTFFLNRRLSCIVAIPYISL